MKKVLVTGGAGFIGSHTVDQLLLKGYKVFVLDNLSTGNKKNLLNKDITFIEEDILNFEKLKSLMREIDYVIHLAANVSVPDSFNNPIKSYDVNVKGTLNVFISAIENKVKKVIYASSAAVYGKNQNIPLREDLDLDPISPYGLHKLINEKTAELLNKNKTTEFIGLRYFNVFGPRQSLTGGYPAVVPIFCKKILDKQPITLFGDGKQFRDFIYVEDIAKINILALEKKVKRNILNVGTGDRVSLLRVISLIEKIVKQKAKIVKKDFREGDIKKSLADISILKSTFFSFRPQKIEDSLVETIKFYKYHEN